MDIDALRNVAPAGAPQPGEDTRAVEARRRARRSACQARGQYRYAQSLVMLLSLPWRTKQIRVGLSHFTVSASTSASSWLALLDT